jgi:fatty acid desaturase
MDASDFNSRGFALGSVAQRVKDWLDWMHPEAWNIEHNRYHHYRLNEEQDPDLVQRNLEWLRDANVPMALKYAAIVVFAPTWKWVYYAPNTWKELEVARLKRDGKSLPEGFSPSQAVTISSFFLSDRDSVLARQVVDPGAFFAKVLGPFFLLRFVALPSLFLAVPGMGPTLALHAAANMILAELLTNMHAFLTIVTNHAGEDLYTFEDAVKPKTPSFYVRQVAGSANYALGSDPVDFFHGFLNYQVEHHVWPDLSMLQYQKAAPRLKEICDRHGVPYVQESVWERLRKTLDVMVGRSTMRRFPVEYEPAKDKAGAGGVTWKATHGAIDGEESGV